MVVTYQCERPAAAVVHKLKATHFLFVAQPWCVTGTPVSQLPSIDRSSAESADQAKELHDSYHMHAVVCA